MGIVYRARQASLKRIVALKMIRAGAQASPLALTRFRNEALAVASLQHPHIVQIYEVGEHQGLPYFSLEFVEGGGLDQLLADKPQPPRPGAALVEKLARAIHYAHEHGIVHRDLKPANVLLSFGREPPASAGGGSATRAGAERLNAATPKITDFGLALQLADEAGVTRARTVLGTPSYMAPEQAQANRAAIGPATDVYAVGAILYEVLTGRPPFLGATPADTVHQVVEQEPLPPSRLVHKVPRDLETICLKCLEKDTRRRYRSALALAEDLNRFLTGRPIKARPTPIWGRVAKWARRRPAVASLLGVSAVALLSILAFGIWYRDRLRTERDHAERSFQNAFAAVEDMLTQAGAADLAFAKRMEQKRRRLLEKALPFYLYFLHQPSADALVRRKAGRAFKYLGDIYRNIGQMDEAETAYLQAIERLDAWKREAPADADFQHDLADSYNWLGELYRTTERLAQAEAAFQDALRLQETLGADYPRRAQYHKEKARTLYNLGLVFKDTDRPRESKKAFQKAIDILQQLADRDPDDSSNRQELARAYFNRGPVLAITDGFEAARASYDRALTLLLRLVAAEPPNPEYRHEAGVALNNRGNLLVREGRRLEPASSRERYLEAAADHERARSFFLKLSRDYPSTPVYRQELANTYNSLGAVRYFLTGPAEVTEAEQAWRAALRQARLLVEENPRVPEYHLLLGQTLGNLGWLWMQQNRFAEAVTQFEKSIRHLNVALGHNPHKPAYRQALYNQYRYLAETLIGNKDHARAAGAATSLSQVFPNQGEGYYFAAGFLARCAGLARSDLSAVGERYAAQALDMLRQALKCGYRINFDADFLVSLKERPDFQQLRAQARRD
jgi:tetratricopeptide (TPR) repeat protein